MKVARWQKIEYGKRALVLLDIVRKTSIQQQEISILALELPKDLVLRKPAPK
jgi:hypothetical protein